MFAAIIAEITKAYAEKVLGEYQSGFRSGRSTIDHIFTIQMSMEACYESNVDVHQLYINYKQPYDS